MKKIVFIGAGSIIFVKNLIGDCMLTPSLCDSEFALLDINREKLYLAEGMLKNLNRNVNGGRATVKAYESQREALAGADFVINAIQVGGYDPCIINDFEIPLKYGLRQTYADTLGIGGIMRGLRTIPVMKGITDDMEELCPNAWLLNYTNPMAIVTGAVLKSSSIKTIGLCHSVQCCCDNIMGSVGMTYDEYTAASQESGILMKADTIEELADMLGFTGQDKDNFLAEVERYNGFYDNQVDEDFGKEAYRLSAIRMGGEATEKKKREGRQPLRYTAMNFLAAQAKKWCRK